MVPREELVLTKIRTKEKKKHELYYFQENLLLDDIYLTKQNLRTLVIIGQPQLTSLSPVSKLIHLQELWAVECKIKDISCLKECLKLEKLYVYSNEIERIPNLSKLSRLTIISLSGNNIHRLTNVNKLDNLKELHLANNKIKRLPNSFGKGSGLKYVNLAGNHLYRLKDIKNLRALPKLESIAFNDPLYGECPLTRLCNYRSYVIYWLPQITRLDHYPVNDAEKCWINAFFKRRVMRYNVLLHNSINEYFKTLKELHKDHREKNKHFKKLLRDSRIQKLRHESSVSEDNALTLIEMEETKLREREEMASSRLRISYQQLKSHMHHCGNVYLREYTNSNDNAMKLCQAVLEESLCSLANNATGIAGVHLHRVTEVLHKEIDEYRVWNDRNDTSCGNIKSLKLLASTPAVGNIRDWPLNVLKSGFYNQRKISLTNCLAIADAKFYEEFSKREETFIDSPEKRRICILLRVPLHRCTVTERYTDEFHSWKEGDKSNRYCQKYVLTRPNLSNAVFVVEYEYVFQSDRSKDDNKEIDPVSPPASIGHLTKREISSFFRTTEADVHILTKVCISGQGIKTLDDTMELPNLRELDLSYNRIELFPNSLLLLNVRKLDVSFNNIRWIRVGDTLIALEDLDISWNRLAKCTRCLQTLKTISPNLKTMNLEKNPFLDIVEHEKIVLLTRAYFPRSHIVTNVKSSESIVENDPICPLDQREDAWSLDCEIMGSNNDNDESINPTEVAFSEKKKKQRTRHVHVSSCDTVPELQGSRKFFNASTICATHCPIMRLQLKKPSIHLVRLNLSDNCINTVDALTQENFPRLRYLDLTNNLLTSLKAMGSYTTILEFYCAHNEIRRLQEIENLKNWHRLRVVDLSYNPMESEMSCKDFLIFHLINLKYVSGEYVETSNVMEARNAFGNVLDKNMLLTMNLAPKLTNVKQLDIVKCSVKTINIPASLLAHLESLDLSRNQISSLENLNTLSKLKTLRMSYNHMEVLDMDRFKDSDAFPNLCTLHLDHNRIGSIAWSNDSHVFPALKHLFLHYNKLANIDGLRENSTLESLIMDHNKVETVDINCFHEYNNIACLSLESNKIQDLQFIKRLSSLKKLYMADNCIANEDELETLNTLEHLEELTLAGNPLCKTMNCYKFGLRNFTNIKTMDGIKLFNKISGTSDACTYECVQMNLAQ